MRLLIGILLTGFIFNSFTLAYAANPALFFSDLISGPSSGLNDGLGDGVIVTVWGYGLGSSQGDSTLSISGQPPAHIYYWKNADGKLPSGPADLYTYNGMQEIAFSIPSSLSSGTHDITVKVGGNITNSLPFTVRAGNIYHVKTTGNNGTGNGSWTSPWATVEEGADNYLSIGDTVYIHNGVQDVSTTYAIRFSYTEGSLAQQIGLIAYPNSRVLAQGYEDGFDMYHSRAFVISKYNVEVGNYVEPTTLHTGVDTVLHYEHARGIQTTADGRIVGCEITDIAGRCTSGGQGAISSNAASYDNVGNAKMFGNYIHDWGCDQTSKLQHTFYLSIRSDTIDNVDPWEMGWNLLLNNKSKYGLHIYDETFGTSCGNWTGIVKIHNNFVKNQRGPGINVGSRAADGSVCWTGGVDIYNNILINTGLGPSDEASAEAAAIRIGDRGMSSNLRIFNNTIYGYGDADGGAGEAGIWFYTIANYGEVKAEITNNIIIDTMGYSFTNIPSDAYPYVNGTTNIWYSTQGTPETTITSLLSNNIMIDPLLSGIDLPGFSLSTDSASLVDIGVNKSSIVSTDFHGVIRPLGNAMDIGAFESSGIMTPQLKITILGVTKITP
ncbi:choice-of-anchor Q domain-containing protein [Desulforhopalus sp. IMCC35007]|uniref:choice-of-anchor Q domain-containing protein n=1 Tax=Desulforhopalus sp. IMCC35007 TaxID=2569543 RepID=UPI0010AE8B95|nr:choice-of-anchor Q domain-containing protein [Desulforhopalus sp. IMCC35007]TKB07404.1 hypothetical protein FCL48_16810 [Desulforhopalus sp. IMCC35007]